MKQIIKIFLPLFLIISVFSVISCSDSSTNSEPEDVISGIYELSGEKIRTRYSEWPIPDDDQPVIDTVGVSFLLKIEHVHDGEGTVRLYGLENVDIGTKEKRVFPNCTDPEDCPFFGKVEDENFEILVDNNGHNYHATGFIYQRYNPYINLTATYQYQNRKEKYTVEGPKQSF